MNTPCEIIVESVPLDGVANMARDEAMLVEAVGSGRCFLRLYEWSAPTISLGYFQKPDEIPAEFSALSFVKRLSGGGAILHHHELTYSLAVPATNSLAKRPTRIYDLVHQEIIKLLSENGCKVHARGETAAPVTKEDEPFLCFKRSDPHDLVVGDSKVLGSAQRRRKGAVLQHGSLMIEASQYAPELPGIADLQSVELSIAGLKKRFAESLPLILSPQVRVCLAFPWVAGGSSTDC